MTGRILVIRLGALGDFVMASGAFASIRAFHDTAHVVLLTRQAYAGLGRAGGWFDDVWIDRRPVWWKPAGVMAHKRRLDSGAFERVYDLQISDRTCAYYHLLRRPRPEWSGVARGCSLHNHRRELVRYHPVERHARQLRRAGVPRILPPDLSMIRTPPPAGMPAGRMALMVPGCAPHRPEKRWPATHFSTLARAMLERGITPLLIGSPHEADVLERIAATDPAIVNMMGRTSLEEIVALARHAVLAVGNDTGPMHIAATAGCACAVLFSRASDPELSRPQGPRVTVLRRDELDDLHPEEVAQALHSLHVWHRSSPETLKA